jgi:hypothetical protein
MVDGMVFAVRWEDGAALLVATDTSGVRHEARAA